MSRTSPRTILTPVLLLCIACGADTGVDAGTTGATGTSTGSTPDETGTTQDPPTTGDVATTTGADPSTSSGSTGAVSATQDGSSSTGAGEEPSTSTGEEPGTSTSTGEEPGTSTGEPPPVDLCANQDDPPPAVMRKAINDDPRFIQVYDNNIENLKIAGEQCAGDWTDLIYYMKTIEPSPDVFLVQQISDPAQLKVLVDRLETELPGAFEGIIADAEPWPQMSPCGQEKALQTNAIIIRTGRFEVVGDKHVWQSWANKDGKCVRNNQARTRNVMVKLRDKIADKHVTIASMHWSTSQGAGDDPACAKANVLEVDEKLHKAGFGGDMVIFGGDFNESDRNDMGDFRAWYKLANGDGGGALNYRDPIYRMCDATDNLKNCLDNNDTGGKRIDMLFAQDKNGCRVRTARAHTITYAEAEAAAKQLAGDSDPDLHYSEHRALRAEFYY